MKKTSLTVLTVLLAACSSNGGSDDGGKPVLGLPDIGGLPSVEAGDVVAFSGTEWESADDATDASRISIVGDNLVFSLEGSNSGKTEFKLDSFKQDLSKGYYISEKNMPDDVWYAKIDGGVLIDDSDTKKDGYVKITSRMKEALVLGGKANEYSYIDFGYWAEGDRSTGTDVDVSRVEYESFAGGFSSKQADDPTSGTFKGQALGGVLIDSDTLSEIASQELVGTVEFTMAGSTLTGQVVFPGMYKLNLNSNQTVSLVVGNTSSENVKFNIDDWTPDAIDNKYVVLFFGPSEGNATEAAGDFGYFASRSDKTASIVGAFGAKRQ
ncbi:MAG: transferrin-binding protein-like solute binding protein [Rickettsiales bacterium]|jgi:hypothetical protein|nr:transferrin-binding protein-like solute binding protein [Rickettsiales bacterium]